MKANYIIAVALCASSCGPENVPPPYAEVGRLNLPGGSWEPVAVAVAPDGRVYVADASPNSAVQVFDAAGLYLGGIGGPGEAPGATFIPWDVAVGPDGDVYVAEFGTRRLSVFDRHGQLRKVIGESVLVAPFGVAAAPGGGVYAADAEAGGVLLFSGEGALLERWGAEANLDRAWDVACDGRGRVAAIAVDRSEIIFLEAEGDPPLPITATGAFVPYELAFGPGGEIFVLVQVTAGGGAEEYHVVHLSPEGVSRETFEIRLTSPTGLAVAPGGALYVADGSRHEVRIFRRPRNRR